ncbi:MULTISPECIES: arginase family protein [unclassified Rathayibacter]|uniref:arginase family protein n=1 Tax=unclassified Rathayibacter TaxID=2609250 RepID=UPI00188A6D46|nr:MULTISPECIES: arginase family protein [unclassified Rathayibacter]MBF4462768.1 arginase family protein [Rathayibacter sp. VKM Ac-2879]MBF4504182.1 arginase family protein [Rathayibacter sp. VKM Ac-2878]
MASFLVVPQWQGSASSRAMRLVDGADAIRGDLPLAATIVVEVPVEAGDAQDTGVRRYASVAMTAERMRDALARLAGPVITVGGDCGVEFAAVTHAVRSASGPVAVLWFDAHPDGNTPQTSPSGAFSGMVLAALAGRGVGLLSAPEGERVAEERLVLAGVRATDPDELEGLVSRGARELGVDALDPEVLVAAVEATGAQSVYVHIDLDVLDPVELAGLFDPVPFGVRAAQLVSCLEAVRARFPLAGAGVTSFAPASPAAAVDDLPTILRLLGALSRGA